jgi:hypothetical protein
MVRDGSYRAFATPPSEPERVPTADLQEGAVCNFLRRQIFWPVNVPTGDLQEGALCIPALTEDEDEENRSVRS